VSRARAEAERALSALEEALRVRTFLVGESVTLADISVFATLIDMFKFLLDAEVSVESDLSIYPEVLTWLKFIYLYYHNCIHFSCEEHT